MSNLTSQITPQLLKELAEEQRPSEAPSAIPPSQQPPVEVVSSPLKFVKHPQNGEYIQKDYNGKIISRVTYKEGKKEGFKVTYTPDDGTIKKVTPYVNGVIEGLEKEVYPNGQLQTVTPYKTGKKEGKVIGYDEEGKIETTSFYVGGKLEGEMEAFEENGLLVAKFTYKNDVLNGPSIDYKKGIPQKISLYENGRLVEIQTCNAQGEVVQIQKIVPAVLF